MNRGDTWSKGCIVPGGCTERLDALIAIPGRINTHGDRAGGATASADGMTDANVRGLSFDTVRHLTVVKWDLHKGTTV